MPNSNIAVLAIHYQNENCHPDGKIRVGISANAAWRWERIRNAKRLLDGARINGASIIHIRLAVTPDYSSVTANTDLIREWITLEAWQEGLRILVGVPNLHHVLFLLQEHILFDIDDLAPARHLRLFDVPRR